MYKLRLPLLQYLSKLKVCLPYDSAFLLLDVNLGETHAHVPEETYTRNVY